MKTKTDGEKRCHGHNQGDKKEDIFILRSKNYNYANSNLKSRESIIANGMTKMIENGEENYVSEHLFLLVAVCSLAMTSGDKKRVDAFELW